MSLAPRPRHQFPRGASFFAECHEIGGGLSSFFSGRAAQVAHAGLGGCDSPRVCLMAGGNWSTIARPSSQIQLFENPEYLGRGA